MKLDKLAAGRRVFDLEIKALESTRDCLNDVFVQILDLIVNCKGKIIITGMGKPGHIASKLAATFSSLGTPSFCLHAGEALHGDLGMISKNDIVVILSNSGESDEIIKILPSIKWIGAIVIGITSNEVSTLAKKADIVQILPKFEEACYMGLAPTSSTTAALCYGDALAVVASEENAFKEKNYACLHPGGSLGKKLTINVDDLMSKGSNNAIIHNNSTLKDAIIELSKKGLGIVSVIDDFNKLCGVITDGDLRRQLEKGVNVYELYAKDVMTKLPVVIASGESGVEALNLMKEHNISCMPVHKQGKVIGTIRLQDIIGAGIVG